MKNLAIFDNGGESFEGGKMSNASHMAYNDGLNAIAAQLKNINKLLKNHSIEAYHDNFSWPYIKDLENISKILGEIERFYG